MTEDQKKHLLKAQQGELDAVILYRKLAEVVKDEYYKEKFLKVSRDEGKHASILKNYTNEVLRPKSLKANLVVTIYMILGRKFTMNMLAKGEMDSIESYSKLVKDFPNIQEIMNDELLHAEIAKGFMNKNK